MLKTKLQMAALNSDHRWFELQLNELPTIRTKISHNKKDIGPALENRICKQMRIRKKFFYELMDCTKYRDDYERQVREDPYPPFSERLV